AVAWGRVGRVAGPREKAGAGDAARRVEAPHRRDGPASGNRRPRWDAGRDLPRARQEYEPPHALDRAAAAACDGASMSDALLSALAAAKSDDDRAWLFVEASLEGLPEPLRASLFAAAIPHRFDAGFLATLTCGSLADSAAALAQLAELDFIVSDRRGGYRVRDEMRDRLLRRMWQTDRQRFEALNGRAATYLASLERDDARGYAEFIYHAALDRPWIERAGGVLDLVRGTFPAWGGAPEFAVCSAAAGPLGL